MVRTLRALIEDQDSLTIICKTGLLALSSLKRIKLLNPSGPDWTVEIPEHVILV